MQTQKVRARAHRDSLYRLGTEIALAAILVGDNIDWTTNERSFHTTKHLNNWLTYLAKRAKMDRTAVAEGFVTALDAGYFTLIENEGSLILSRSLPGGDVA